ncbi:hypothetical protein [Nocardioides nitrophenolicus]|nr:hypothetical protein [Nocardioides nitrophenolicus]MBM7515262.1 hypothetical protein [Nocardioides nitrophenolicus]
MGTLASIVVGGVVALATIWGVVDAQTSTPDQSPANVSKVGIDYGSTQ